MKTQTGKFRIISGKCKGRILRFPAVNDLRPTPERIRETLYNWLMPYVSGSHCLDLFAGSGALGLEALSRDARSATFVESNRNAARAISKNIQILQLEQASVVNQDSINYLQYCGGQFDIVFLDPPFNSDLLQSSIDLINEHKLINKSGWVYTEYSAHSQPPDCPVYWKIHRQTKAGDVRACLFHHADESSQ